MTLILQVDYKRLSEDLSKIVDMRGTFFYTGHYKGDTTEKIKLPFMQ